MENDKRIEAIKRRHRWVIGGVVSFIVMVLIFATCWPFAALYALNHYREKAAPAHHANGECHRYPPTVIPHAETRRDEYGNAYIETYPFTVYPEVLPTEWCGEWKDKLCS